MNETAKAMRRRYVEDAVGIFPWMKIFRGDGIDVGCGPDKLPFDRCRGFDLVDGDANRLASYFDPESFSYVHASQALEHMINPAAALREWLTLVKPRGHLIFSVPDWCLYEKMTWPSRWNPDHKSTWSLHIKDSPAPIHCYIPEFLKTGVVAEVLRAELIDTNYNYKVNTLVDQTYIESDGVEAFIEVVLKKHGNS